MSTYSDKVLIATLSLIITSSAIIQTSYSQQSISNSSISASGKLQMDLGLTRLSNNSQMERASTPNQMKYEDGRDQLLKVWDRLEFEPRVATFVNESEAMGNGQYLEHSNDFAPNETVVLYVQPIGFGHKQIQGQDGEKLFLMNFTADIVASAKNGTVVEGWHDIPLPKILSHYRNTELYYTLSVTLPDQFTKGWYLLKYTFKDQTTGKSFDITKDINIS
jgi:hypothetical protein